MENARKKLEDVRESMTKPVLPKYIEKLNPSKDGREIAYFNRINKKVKDNFNKTKPQFGNLNVENSPGAQTGNTWHTSLKKCIASPETSDNEIGKAVIDAVKKWLLQDDKGNLELLQSEFTLNGYMKFKENDGGSEISFWSGNADAIGWYNDNYVIVEWKVVNILEFWEIDKRAYGIFLHQCLVYARLLELHLGLPKLPYILIVPICSFTGKDIRPALFTDFPQECKDEIETYEWLTKLKPAKLSLPSGMFNNVVEIRRNDDRVHKDKKLRDVLKDDYTVKQFLVDKHELNKDSTVKQLLETLVPRSLHCTIEQLLNGFKYDEMRLQSDKS